MKHQQQRKICDSWYHQKWFRVLLVIVGVDMIVLGATFAVGVDVMSIIADIPLVFRIIAGLAYILVALFIIHQALSYNSMHRHTAFVCQHCAHVKSEKEV